MPFCHSSHALYAIVSCVPLWHIQIVEQREMDMTKKEAKQRRDDWHQALVDGRIVRLNGGTSLRSFKTREAAKEYVANNIAAGLVAEIVTGFDA